MLVPLEQAAGVWGIRRKVRLEVKQRGDLIAERYHRRYLRSDHSASIPMMAGEHDKRHID